MSTPSIWHLDESAKLARSLLSAAADGIELSSWRSCVRQWRKKKSALIAALCPETGRRETPIAYAPAGETAARAWFDALQSGARELTRCASEDAQMRYLGNPTDLARASAEKKQRTYSLVVSALAHFQSFRERLYSEEAKQGRIIDGLHSSICPTIKKGMTISRALSAWLRHHGLSADDAALVVDAVVTAAQVAPRKGTLVLSANILDLLTVSEHCSYSSCHSLDGCHRAGPQQYLYDPHTLVCYYFEERRRYTQSLPSHPYKLFRQMVHVDARHQAAALQRHYGSRLPDEAHQSIRREVARLLHHLAGPEPEAITWKHAGGDAPGKASIRAHGCHLAYQDYTADYVSLGSERPVIDLASAAPCPACGERLDSAEHLVCTDCNDGGYRCERCGESVSGEDTYSADGDDSIYCERCFHRLYSTCPHCEEYVRDEDGEAFDGSFYHPSCLSECVFSCQSCGEVYSNDDDDGDGYCPRCSPFRDCIDCGESYNRHDDTDPERDSVPEVEESCPSCVAEQHRRLILIGRLVRSPRYFRLAILDALYGTSDSDTLAILWCDRDTINTSPSYLSRALPLAHTYHGE